MTTRRENAITATINNSITRQIDAMRRSNPRRKAAHIMDILAKLGREFEMKPDLLQIRDLVQEAPQLASEVVSQALGMDIKFIPTSTRTANIVWNDLGQYAPKRLSFYVDENTILSIDENGNLQSPFMLQKYEHVMRYLSYNSAFLIDTETYTELYGTTGDALIDPNGGDINRFYPSRAIGTEDVFMVAPWGGPQSSTRGIPEKDAQRMIERGAIEFFERRSSKSGGEGCDYFVLSLESHAELAKAVALDEAEFARVQAEQLACFAQKLEIVEQIEAGLETLTDQYDAVCLELNELRETVCANPLLDKPFVFAPDLEIAPPEILSQRSEISTQMSLENLTAMKLDFDILLGELKDALECKEIEVAAWQDFAPRFYELQPLARKLYGRIEIHGAQAKLYVDCLKDYERSQGTKPFKVFPFTESDLLECVQLLQNHLAKADEFRKEGNEILTKLLAGEKAEPSADVAEKVTPDTIEVHDAKLNSDETEKSDAEELPSKTVSNNGEPDLSPSDNRLHRLTWADR